MSIRERLSKETAIKIAYGWDGTVRDKWNDIEVLADLIATALNDQAAEYDEVLEDKKRLVRELDVAMHGEEGAAKQASLCDLVPMAKLMRDELDTLRTRSASYYIAECQKIIEREKAYFNKDGQHACMRLIYCLDEIRETRTGGDWTGKQAVYKTGV